MIKNEIVIHRLQSYDTFEMYNISYNTDNQEVTYFDYAGKPPKTITVKPGDSLAQPKMPHLTFCGSALRGGLLDRWAEEYHKGYGGSKEVKAENPTDKELEAIKYHLEDMRKLVFNSLLEAIDEKE